MIKTQQYTIIGRGVCMCVSVCYSVLSRWLKQHETESHDTLTAMLNSPTCYTKIHL